MTTIGIWLAGVLALAHAVAAVERAPAPGAQEEQAEVRLLAWSGKPEGLRAGQEAIARARVLAEVEGDLVGAEALLNGVWLQAISVHEFAGQRELLAEVARARAELYQAMGDPVQALAAAEELLIRADDGELVARLGIDGSELVEAPARLVARAREARQDAGLAQLRDRLGASGARTAAPVPSLEDLVREAYDYEDYGFVLEIGEPAQAYLMEAMLPDADTFPEHVNTDPLRALILINERKAAQLLLANLDAGGDLWKRRILRAMDAVDVLADEGTWTGAYPFTCLEPEWLELLEALLAAPDTARQSVHLLKQPFLRDQLTPGLQRAAVRGLESFDADFANALMGVLDEREVVDSELPILEAATRHSSPEIRRFAALELVQFESSEALKALAADPDPRIRAAVAQSLLPHSGKFIRYWQHQTGTWQNNPETIRWAPAVGERERALLRALAEDPDPRVRRTVADGLARLEEPLEDEVYLRLAADPDSSVRRAMANVSSTDRELRGQILAQLSADPSGDVLEEVVDVLLGATGERLDLDPEPYLEALELRMFSTDHSLADELDVYQALLATKEGTRALVGWALRDEDGQILRTMISAARRNQPTQPFARLVQALDDPLLAGFFVAMSQPELWKSYQGDLDSTLFEARPPRRAAMRAVLADPEVDPSIRLRAAIYAAPDGGEAFRAALLGLLGDPLWQERKPTDDDRDLLHTIVKYEFLPRGEMNPLILALIREEEAPDDLCAAMVGEYDRSAPLAREITLGILERWFRPEEPTFSPVETALRQLATMPEDANPELLIAAARNPEYAEAAVSTMVALREHRFAPTLGACLEAEWIESNGTRREVQNLAANGLASLGSDVAAEILLEGIRSPDRQVRNNCGTALSQIEAYRARKRRWEEDEARVLPTREGALLELIGMLDAENREVRIQAIQGIAAFRALEALPALIRLLQDPDDEVRTAARAALERLRAAPAAEPGEKAAPGPAAEEGEAPAGESPAKGGA